ncbi:unnamed protein product [Closterium sp. NIES-53]
MTISDEGDCYRCFPPDPGIGTAALGAGEASALGASASVLSGVGETALSGTSASALLGTASASASLTFTLDSGASRSFFRDRTTLTPLSRPVAVSLADPSGGPVLSRFSTVLPCPAAPSGALSGLYLPSFSTNLVSGAALQDAGVHQFTPAGQRVTHCTEASTGRHLATFTRQPGSSLYTLSTPSPPVPESGRVLSSSQRAAPHSSQFPPTEAPLQTLHMDVWGPARVRGLGHERYFLLVVDDYSRYTTVFPLRSKEAESSPLAFCVPSVVREESRFRDGLDLCSTRLGELVLESLEWERRVPLLTPHCAHQQLVVVLHREHWLSLHEEIWLRRPPGFTGSFPSGTQWSLRRPVYGLRQAPREWHDTLRTTLAALGFAPSTADPSLFLRTDTSLPPFYILVYVDDLVFATADTAGLAYVKSELQKRHTCTDLGELRSYLGLQITRDRARRTITLTQSHMVQQVLQRFGFTYSSPQATPLPTRHSLSALPSDESVESSGPYAELVGCLMYLMTCTRPDLAYPLSILARYVAPWRHRPEHMAAAKRVLRYLCSTSGMGLVLGGRSPVVLTGHADTSWADDQATQRSSQGYTFGLGSGSVS